MVERRDERSDDSNFTRNLLLIVAVVAVVGLVTADSGITGFPVANQPRGANGQACRARAPLCDAGLQCVNRVCRPEPPRGGLAQSCRARNPRCDAGLACVQGVCRVPQAVGGACRNSQECQGGLVCITGRCANPRQVGEACNAQIPCAPGLNCRNNVCAAPIVCGNRRVDAGETCSSCPADVACAVGQACQNGACELQAPQLFCRDSDAAFALPGDNYLNNLGNVSTTFGTVTYLNETTGQEQTRDDFCLGMYHIAEQYCNGVLRNQSIHTCPAGRQCQNGACE